jgi:hypothetical protein
MLFVVAIKDNGVVITSSHSQTQKYFNDKNKAEVHDLSQTEYLFQVYFANFFSNLSTTSQVVKNKELTTFINSFLSLYIKLCL